MKLTTTKVVMVALVAGLLGSLIEVALLAHPSLDQAVVILREDRKGDARLVTMPLRRLLQELKQQFGYAILLAGHSMPGSGRAGHGDTGNRRADIVPGSRSWTTAAPRVIHCPEELALKRGWSVAHDTPYRGGFTTMHYGQPEQGVHAVQVEINRALYMDEVTLAAKPTGFAQTQAFCDELVERLGQLDMST